MSQPNRVQFSISEEDLQLCMDLINRLRGKLLPLLITLTPEERQQLPKMGDKSIAFVEKALEYSQANPDLVPPFMNVADFEQDVKAVLTLRKMLRPLLQLVEALDDTTTLSGSEGYSASLMYYKSAQHAAGSNYIEAKTIAEDLAARFPRGRRSSESSEAAASAAKE